MTTAGGVSVALGATITGFTDLALSGQPPVALSGTPAVAGQASANPGQAITLLGSGLSTSTLLIMTYTNSVGTPR